MISHGDDTYRYPDIRLNFSSNVYNGFDHSGLMKHLCDRMSLITSYPEPDAASLERMIEHKIGVEEGTVMVTNGAIEAIYLIAKVFSGSRSCIVQPTFSEYEAAARCNNHRIRNVLNLADAFRDKSPELLWICNPNNPTGTVTPREKMLSFIENHPETLFVIDSSYAPFTVKALLEPADVVGMNNVLMLRSMTKEYAIPGLRLGYVIAEAGALSLLRQHRMPWSVNTLAIEAGKYLLPHSEEYCFDLPELLNERQRVAETLAGSGKFDVFPSDTHILLCRLHHGTASDLKEHLALNHGILIRDASNFTGLDESFFRIAVQSKEDNNALLNQLLP